MCSAIICKRCIFPRTCYSLSTQARLAVVQGEGDGGPRGGGSKRTKESADRRESRQWPSLYLCFFGCLDLGLTGLSRIYFVCDVESRFIKFCGK